MKKQKAIREKKLVQHQLQVNQAQTILAGGGGSRPELRGGFGWLLPGFDPVFP